jgi:hypothetical protein
MNPLRVRAFALGVLAAGLSVSLGAQQVPEKSSGASKPGMMPSESAPAPFRPPVPSRLQGFNVVLLLGDMAGADSQDTVPAAARRALNDMKDFLPYKSYRLLDTQWVLCCAGGSGSAFTRLRGLDEQEYELEVRGSPDLKANIHVHFLLREPAEGSPKSDSKLSPLHPKEIAKGDSTTAEISRDIFTLDRERVDMNLQLTSLRGKVEIGMANPEEVKRMEAQLSMINRRINELKQSLEKSPAKTAGRAVIETAGRAVIDSSFRMEEGETVVVGSSGVKGKRALIALLTAAAPGSGKKD